MFSSRVPAHLESNRFSLALARARAAGRPLIDLTLTNPTQAGIAYPPDLFGALAHPAASVYAPEPFGLQCAREAVAADFGRKGIAVDADRIVLTSSTSEAYSLLFKLLCEPAGDTVLAPVPSYPLFEHLTSLDGVVSEPYRLRYDGRWWLDAASLAHVWSARVRAVLAVSPNNPTGSVLSPGELRELDSRCAAADAALIVDEVFADYPLAPDEMAANAGIAQPASLTFRLGGLSKSAALPQVKLGWIAVDGPDALVRRALGRLELICDTYLSVSTPVQLAAAGLIARGAEMRRQVLERIRANHSLIREMAAAHPAVDLLHAQGGWSAVLRIPARASEEETVLALLERDGVVVHPGYFFDFPHEAFLVVSLLPPIDHVREGLARVLERVNV
ncbi:MAG: pyridoxal phosphate-dependent aminotransferase [Vicinamibacterales bacterium]